MRYEIFRADSRGGADYGWLKTKYSFSFAEYYAPNRMGFGALRVLNDDTILGGGGFPFHSHKDMEIVTIPFSGALEHKDTSGGSGIIKAGDVQIMSAGSGITHSEFNHSKTEALSLFQIWITPEKEGLTPRYEQKIFPKERRLNTFQLLVSPEGGEPLKIHQHAYISIADFDADTHLSYNLHGKNQGLFCINIKGEISILDEKLNEKDAIEITGASAIALQGRAGTMALVIEIPLGQLDR